MLRQSRHMLKHRILSIKNEKKTQAQRIMSSGDASSVDIVPEPSMEWDTTGDDGYDVICHFWAVEAGWTILDKLDRPDDPGCLVGGFNEEVSNCTLFNEKNISFTRNMNAATSYDSLSSASSEYLSCYTDDSTDEEDELPKNAIFCKTPLISFVSNGDSQNVEFRFPAAKVNLQIEIEPTAKGKSKPISGAVLSELPFSHEEETIHGNVDNVSPVPPEIENAEALGSFLDLFDQSTSKENYRLTSEHQEETFAAEPKRIEPYWLEIYRSEQNISQYSKDTSIQESLDDKQGSSQVDKSLEIDDKAGKHAFEHLLHETTHPQQEIFILGAKIERKEDHRVEDPLLGLFLGDISDVDQSLQSSASGSIASESSQGIGIIPSGQELPPMDEGSTVSESKPKIADGLLLNQDLPPSDAKSNYSETSQEIDDGQSEEEASDVFLSLRSSNNRDYFTGISASSTDSCLSSNKVVKMEADVGINENKTVINEQQNDKSMSFSCILESFERLAAECKGDEIPKTTTEKSLARKTSGYAYMIPEFDQLLTGPYEVEKGKQRNSVQKRDVTLRQVNVFHDTADDSGYFDESTSTPIDSERIAGNRFKYSPRSPGNEIADRVLKDGVIVPEPGFSHWSRKSCRQMDEDVYSTAEAITSEVIRQSESGVILEYWRAYNSHRKFFETDVSNTKDNISDDSVDFVPGPETNTEEDWYEIDFRSATSLDFPFQSKEQIESALKSFVSYGPKETDATVRSRNREVKDSEGHELEVFLSVQDFDTEELREGTMIPEQYHSIDLREADDRPRTLNYGNVKTTEQWRYSGKGRGKPYDIYERDVGCKRGDTEGMVLQELDQLANMLSKYAVLGAKKDISHEYLEAEYAKQRDIKLSYRRSLSSLQQSKQVGNRGRWPRRKDDGVKTLVKHVPFSEKLRNISSSSISSRTSDFFCQFCGITSVFSKKEKTNSQFEFPCRKIKCSLCNRSHY